MPDDPAAVGSDPDDLWEPLKEEDFGELIPEPDPPSSCLRFELPNMPVTDDFAGAMESPVPAEEPAPIADATEPTEEGGARDMVGRLGHQMLTGRRVAEQGLG